MCIELRIGGEKNVAACRHEINSRSWTYNDFYYIDKKVTTLFLDSMLQTDNQAIWN